MCPTRIRVDKNDKEKNAKNLLFTIIVSVGILTCCDSCKEDDWVEFSYKANFSESLLEFITPVATYTNENGTKESVEISQPTWTKIIKYEGDKLDVHTEMVINFKRKENAPEVETKHYAFSYGVEESYQGEINSIMFMPSLDKYQSSGFIINGADLGIEETKKQVNDNIDKLIANPYRRAFHVKPNGEIDKE